MAISCGTRRSVYKIAQIPIGVRAKADDVASSSGRRVSTAAKASAKVSSSTWSGVFLRSDAETPNMCFRYVQNAGEKV